MMLTETEHIETDLLGEHSELNSLADHLGVCGASAVRVLRDRAEAQHPHLQRGLVPRRRAKLSGW